jgi:hypothetical protein
VPDDNKDLYQILIPKEWKTELLESVAEASNETGGADYTLTEADPAKTISELQFEPILTAAALTVAGTYVGNLVVNRLAGKIIDKALEKLGKRLRALGKPPTMKPILILLPNGDVEELDPFDAAGSTALLERLKKV